MKRNAIFVILAVLLLLSCCGCGPAQTQTPTTEPTQPVVEGEPGSVCPWELDAVAEAKKTGTIHYYFMASHGLFMSAEENHPYKWGDSCLVVFPNGETMLIDGGMEVYAPVLVKNLKRLGIEKLDYVMMSHCHNDHCFGLLRPGGVFENFPVGKIYWTGIISENWVADAGVDLLAECEKFGYPMEALQQGDVRQFGDATMEVLWPAPGRIGTGLDNATDLNNQSMVVRFDYKDHSSLFTGDLYTEAEQQVVEANGEKVDVQLLKAPHHGSPTSSSVAFLSAVTPKLAVATGYQDVTFDMIERYDAMGARLLYDQYNGYVHISSDGTEMTYDTLQTRRKK